MKYYTFNSKDKNIDLQTKKIKIGRIIKLILVLLLIALILTLVFQYRYNEEFREFFDVKILRKEISNENTIQIDISSKTSPTVYTYYKYVTILDKNILEVYTGSSKPDYTIDVTVSTPIYASNNRFLCIAEKGGGKAYLISGQNIIWQKDVEGQINSISVNKNGYVAIDTSSSGYKTIITLYNPTGEELFKTYLKTTYSADIEISNDNKYLAIAEVNTSSTSIQSNVKIVSIENAKNNREEAFINSYKDSNKSIILNLKYQDKNNLICMYNDKIISMQDEITELKNFDSNIAFADIELRGAFVEIAKQIGGILKADYYAYITDLNTFERTEYKLNGVPKAVYCNSDIIAINYGTEVEIINTGGWLLKRYRSSLQEINDIGIGTSVAAIVYKNKVEIVNL